MCSMCYGDLNIARGFVDQVRKSMANHVEEVDECLEAIEKLISNEKYQRDLLEQILIGRLLLEKINEATLIEEIEELTK